METNKSEMSFDEAAVRCELADLKGRINALKVYLDSTEYHKKEVILKMLGVEVDG